MSKENIRELEKIAGIFRAKEYRKEIFNPIELMKGWGWPTDHITYDPTMKKHKGTAQYDIIRQVAHDGTFVFTYGLLQRTLASIASMTSYCLRDDIKHSDCKRINYRIGALNLATVFGQVKVPAGEFPGERQRTRLPVQCEYFF